MQALLRATPPGESAQAWLVCDHTFIRRYGLGAVKPAPLPLTHWLRNGYLLRAGSLAELAQACVMPPQALAHTVARYNTLAFTGLDTDFAKGQTAYNRLQGDAPYTRSKGLPNPCMASIERAPFYAMKVVPGSLGTFAGLAVDTQARVLDAQAQPIPGLYAAGNDMSSLMGGHYPSGGITLGPAMTFGFIAGQHAAQASGTNAHAQKV
jgi:succinate dehydrogenase/fumarate reductase flavoprotein subunit